MPRFTYTTFDGVVHTHELKPGRTRVGRTPDNDLQIDELEISIHHCELHLDKSTLTVKDLGSTSGIFVDGQPTREATLSPGQVLCLGTFMVSVSESVGDASAAATWAGGGGSGRSAFVAGKFGAGLAFVGSPGIGMPETAVGAVLEFDRRG